MINSITFLPLFPLFCYHLSTAVKHCFWVPYVWFQLLQCLVSRVLRPANMGFKVLLWPLSISAAHCHPLTASTSWVPSTSLDRFDCSHPCLVVLPASVLKTHFYCCFLKTKMLLKTAVFNHMQKQPQLPKWQQSTRLTRIEQDDGLKAHKFLPLKVHHAKPSSSSQQHVKDFHHALYTFPLIPVWIP